MESNLANKIGALIFSSFFAVVSATAFAQSTTTSGDLCDVKNPSAKDIRRDFGGIANIRSSGNFNVSCPLTLIAGASSYFVAVGLENFHENGRSQRFRCTLNEHDVANFRVNQYSRSVAIESGFVDFLLFEDIRLEDELNRLHLICTMPPRSYIGAIGIDNN